MSQLRPSLGSRAVSELSTLKGGAPADKSKKDLGHGTHSLSAGKKVGAGKQLALGGIAPMSPFLPFPSAGSAISSSELEHLDLNATDAGAGKRGTSLRGHDDFEEAGACSMARARQHRAVTITHKQPAPAPLMIRSYSMPVATQNEYEAYRKADISRRKSSPLSQCGTPLGARTPLTTLSAPSMTMTPLTSIAASDFESKNRTSASASSSDTRRSSGISSDEDDEIVTPQPLHQSSHGMDIVDFESDAADYFSDAKGTSSAVATFTIHPDHLQRPHDTLH